MKKLLAYFFCYFIFIPVLTAQQNVDEVLSKEKMEKDLALFRSIRKAANSGVYKYRSEAEIDSIYQWANQELINATTYLDFYKILLKITDFEGSLHNDTYLPTKIRKALRAEKTGYFPIPIKLIQGNVLVNSNKFEIPLGSQLVSINGKPLKEIIPQLYKYYTTDGFNITGKRIGIHSAFAKYMRLEYGQQATFVIDYIPYGSSKVAQMTLPSVGYIGYRKGFAQRHSRSIDHDYYRNYKTPEEKYQFQLVNETTASLTVKTFSIGGNAKDPAHLEYVAFLDSCFLYLQQHPTIVNLIIDVRANGGGSDPNDQITYSYVAPKPFVENTSAWVSANKVPYWKYVDLNLFFLMKPIARVIYNKSLKKEFSIEKDGRYYQGEDDDNIPRKPSPYAFKGQVYLLISPRIASAGSMFAAMVAGNTEAIIVGEETMGTYYGHNGHTSIAYKLPKSDITMSFSVVNLKQDVQPKSSQPFGYGVRPDHEVSQTVDDFLENKDSQMIYVLQLINEGK